MSDKRLPPHFIELVQDTLLKSFWRKRALRDFLRRSHVSDSALSQLPSDESKRDWLHWLFPKLESSERGKAAIQQMGRALAEQETFPDLENWEDSTIKIAAAREAVRALRDYFKRKDEDKQQEKEQQQVRQRAAEIQERNLQTRNDLTKLTNRLNELATQLGTQQAGTDFEIWFYDLMDYCEIDNRRPFTADGRQIDGSITIDGTTYLVELKFTAGSTSSPDVDIFDAKLKTKADNTMGIMVSISGYTGEGPGGKGAIETASYDKTPLLLFDHAHIYMVLQGIERFDDVVRRVRRHSSQTGKAYLAITEFGGA